MSLNVSSATQLNGDYNMDLEQDVLSPAVLDHTYHSNAFPATPNDNGQYSTPSQSTDAIEGGNAVQESSDSEDVKPNLEELNTVNKASFEDTGVQGTSFQGASDLSSAVSGYIQGIPVNEVPYNVNHEDIASALSVNDEKVPVRTMRKVIPCLRITAYLKEAEFSGKKKIKGLWAIKPEDWPIEVPYKDPNNGEKIDGKLVPKANSEELRAMFKFLKNKVMLNIFAHINQLNQEDLAVLQAQGNEADGNNRMGQYYFNSPQQQSNMCKTEVDSSPCKYQLPYTGQPLQQQAGQQVPTEQYWQQTQQPQIKQESTYFVPAAPESETCIPTVVADEDFGSSSPEGKTNSSPDTSINPSVGSKLILQEESLHDSDNMQESDNSEDSSDGNEKCWYFIDEQGQKFLVKLPANDTDSSSSSSDGGLEIVEKAGNMVPEPRQLQQQKVPIAEKVPVKRPAAVEPQVSMSQSHGGGKRIREQSGISRGPFHQASSPQSSVGEGLKGMREVTPQIRASPLPQAEAVPSSQVSYQHELMINQTRLAAAAQMSYQNTTPMTIFPPGPIGTFSSVTAENLNRSRLLEDIHNRLREKVMQLQGMVLGDLEISAGLNQLYKDVVLRQYNLAQIGHQNQFITASHDCEALLDRALLDGKNFEKQEFVNQCNIIIKKFIANSEEKIQKTTVLNVAAPDHPPVQANWYDKQSMDQSPFSPGLSADMDRLMIEKSTKTSAGDLNPGLLGIKPRSNDTSMMALLNDVVQPFKQAPAQPDENLLPIPEKLTAMGLTLEAEELSPDVMEDLMEQLKQFASDVNNVKLQDVVEISDDDDDDDNAVDVKKQKVNADIPNQTSQPIVGQPQKRGPKADSSMMNLKKPEIFQENNVMSDTFKDDVIDEVLGLEADYDHYEVDWSPSQTTPSVEKQQDKMPLQPATPDDGNICISTTFGNACTASGKQKAMMVNHGKKPYQRIKPKPQQPPPSYNMATYGAHLGGMGNLVLTGSVNGFGQHGTFPPTSTGFVSTPNMSQPATSVYIPQNAFGGGPDYNNGVAGPSCIPEVVENFESPPLSNMGFEDGSKRPRGRKRIHNE